MLDKIVVEFFLNLSKVDPRFWVINFLLELKVFVPDNFALVSDVKHRSVVNRDEFILV